MKLKRAVIYLLRTFGILLVRNSVSNNPSKQLVNFFKLFEIDFVIDVGANSGQFGKDIISHGYKSFILSFEPLTDAHTELVRQSRAFDNWKVYDRIALGEIEESITINVSGNSVSSSLLPMTQKHKLSSNNSAYISSEIVQVKPLDSIIDSYIENQNRVFLKIDAQGFEWQVLKGAVNTLKSTTGILIELSFVELYKGQKLWRELVDFLYTSGFELWAIQRGFTDVNTGQSLQADVIFVRKELL